MGAFGLAAPCAWNGAAASTRAAAAPRTPTPLDILLNRVEIRIVSTDLSVRGRRRVGKSTAVRIGTRAPTTMTAHPAFATESPEEGGRPPWGSLTAHFAGS